MRRSLVAFTGLLGANLLVLSGLAHTDASASVTARPDRAKLDAGLAVMVDNLAKGRPASAPAAKVAGVSIGGVGRADPAGRTQVDVDVDGSLTDAVQALESLGMDVTATSDAAPGQLVEGSIPVSALTDVTALAQVRAVSAVPDVVTNEGSVLSQGDAAHHGPQARALGATGAGVKVGIISDSINQVGTGVAGDQATGDLPGPASVPAGAVHVLADGAGGTDEGRAMAQIVFDEAPGIRDLYFNTANGGPATKAAGIANLVAQGVTVIADDTTYFSQPFFQDGVIAQAVDAASAAGVTYLISAGNRARQSWEGVYAPMTDPRGLSSSTNDFDPSAAQDAVQTTANIPANRSVALFLQWAEPLGAVTDDFAVDVYLDGAFAATFDTNNVVTGIPSESFSVNNGTASSHTIGIGLRHVAGSGTPLLKYIENGNFAAFTIPEYPTNSQAIDPDAASARSALTVAASQFSTPSTPESFSSRGPAVTRFFSPTGVPLATPDVRAKPNLAAADGVATTLGPLSGLNPFFGTSAAAPAAAGIAALIRSARPTLTAAQVATILTDPAFAQDCTATAGQPDLDCGVGFILADKMVAAAKDASPPSVSPVTTPAVGPGGWFRGTVSVSWAVADAESPIFATSGCTAGTFASAGVSNCSATSVGGTTAKSLSIRIDKTAPTKLKAKGLRKTYRHGTKPAKKKIKCRAKDRESGIFSCKLKGLKTTPGTHKVTVIATNGAGLVTKKKFRYTIL